MWQTEEGASEGRTDLGQRPALQGLLDIYSLQEYGAGRWELVGCPRKEGHVCWVALGDLTHSTWAQESLCPTSWITDVKMNFSVVLVRERP